MMKSIIRIFLVLFVFSSCDKENVSCTEEFRSIGIEVVGEKLFDFYTRDTETQETLRFESFFEEGFYPVLDDSYFGELKGKERKFIFIGLDDMLDAVVSEEFVIGADQCHIYKVSGRESVDL